MIIYDLECASGHRFEGWFPSIQAFEKQEAAGMVYCAVCGLNTVKRVPSACLSVGREAPAFSKPALKPKPETHAESDTHLNVDPVTLMKAVDHFIKTNFKNVGAEFAKKAVDIHHGKAPREAIYGTATPPEQELLEEEGVSFSTLPRLPESTEN